MKLKTFLILLLAVSNLANAGDVDFSASSITPINDSTISVQGLKYAPAPPDFWYNVDFLFNQETLQFEPDLETLVVVDEANYAEADMVRGGLLYDNWWKINGENEPADTYPVYPEEGSNTGSTTWRCKECHGWDYKGYDGAYESGSHYTGISGLYHIRNQPVAEIYAAIVRKNMPLSEQDIWDLTKFLKEGLFDMNKYIIFSGTHSKSATGDAENGRILYESVGGCNNCHGADGNKISSISVKAVTNNNPWSSLHKIRFGKPGTRMPSAINKGLSLQEQIDILTYAQTLPQE